MWPLPKRHEIYTRKTKHSPNKNTSWEGDIINETLPRVLSCCNYQVFLTLQQRLMTRGEGDRSGTHILWVLCRTEMECKIFICCSASLLSTKWASKTNWLQSTVIILNDSHPTITHLPWTLQRINSIKLPYLFQVHLNLFLKDFAIAVWLLTRFE